jgi:hypothetical protein
MKKPWSDYAPLPSRFDGDHELGLDDPANLQWSARRILARAFTPKKALLAIGVCLVVAIVMSQPSTELHDIAWKPAQGQQARLDFIQRDGDHIQPSDNAVLAQWPKDYREAAQNLAKNGHIPSSSNPWPQKPWLASIWLSPERFPDHLPRATEDLGILPPPGKEYGKKLASSPSCFSVCILLTATTACRPT